MTRPRVLIDARKARDFGIGTYVLGLLGGLARLDRFELVALVRPGDEGLFSDTLRTVPSAAPHYSLRELVAVRQAIGAVAPDVFHAPHYVVPLFPPRATIVTVHDLMHLDRPEHASPAKRIYARTMLRRAVGAAAGMIAVSADTRRELIALDPRAEAMTEVILNGVDERFLAVAPADAARMRARHGSYLLFLGNDKPHKNLDGLLDAFARARPVGVTLVLAGGAETRRPARRAAIEARGLGTAVVDLGVVPSEDVPPLVAGARALALPSFAEGFGLPVLEAQAAGTPVVCSDRGGLPEAAGGAALLVDPGDPAALAAALTRIVGDEELRARLSSDGRRNTAGRTWAHVAVLTAALYERALAR